jgi:hypothetical protein
MKRKWMMLMLMTALAAGLPAASIEITRPNTAVSWGIGRSEAITWNFSDLTGQVKLTLIKDGVRLGNIARNRPIADRSYSWTVGHYGDGLVATAGGGYQVRISLQDHEDEYSDVSAVSFTLTAPALPTIPAPNNTLYLERAPLPPPAPSDIQVVYPNGGETLNQGVEYQIQWRAPDSFGRPRVIFRKAGHRVKTIEPADVFPVKIGDTWRLSWIVGAEFTSGSDYDIRLEKADGSQGDFCDRLFTIHTGDPYIVYAGPTDRELILGRWELIRWRSGNLRSPITVTLWKEGSGSQGIASNLPADARSFRWHVGLLTSGSSTFINSTDNFRIHVESAGAPVTSSQNFKLVNPGLEVTAPGGGEVHRGDTLTIRWRSDRGFSGNVNIEIWRDHGRGVFYHYQTLFENIESHCSATWRIWPNPGFGEADLDPPPVNCQYRIRVGSSDISIIRDDGEPFILRR